MLRHPAEQRDGARRDAEVLQDGGAAADAEGHLGDPAGHQAQLGRRVPLRLLRGTERGGR